MSTPWKSRTLILLATTAAYWIVMCIGTHLPGSMVPGGGHTDKLYHLGAFFGLAILVSFCVRCFSPLRWWHCAAIVGSIAVYGVVDELTQKLAINRSADPLDWLADVSGATLGASIFAGCSYLMHKRDQGATG